MNLQARAPAKSTFDVEGYYCPKTGPLTTHPKYTIPKDKGSDFLSKIRKHSAKIPAPNKYHKPANWVTKNGQFHKLQGGNRLTSTDATIKWQKKEKIPSCASYDLTAKFYKVPMGKME
jgi:hypothetical protein